MEKNLTYEIKDGFFHLTETKRMSSIVIDFALASNKYHGSCFYTKSKEEYDDCVEFFGLIENPFNKSKELFYQFKKLCAEKGIADLSDYGCVDEFLTSSLSISLIDDNNTIINSAYYYAKIDNYYIESFKEYINNNSEQIVFSDIISKNIFLSKISSLHHQIRVQSFDVEMILKDMIDYVENGEKSKPIIYTYLIIDNHSKLIKIGRSTDVDKRIESLSTGNCNLSIVAVKDADIERMLHDEYGIFRVKGEWFNFSEKKLNEIIEKYDFKIRTSYGKENSSS